MENETVFQEILDYFATVFVFLITLSLSPLLLLSYTGVKLARHLWYLLLSVLNPNLDFIKNTTIRTLVDSHRNQGIFVVLLTLKGRMNFDAVRRHLQEVTTCRDKEDRLVFPRLQQSLTTCWGKYAWYKRNFCLDDNLIIAPPITNRGRPISENNIQEYVSEIVAKYLGETPPWQVIIIPSVENQHYILLRIHHALINEGLHIADLLPLAPPVYQHTEETNIIKSPLLNVFKKPHTMLRLKMRIQEDLCNLWNGFIDDHDPLEKPELLKKKPGLFQYFAVLLITFIAIVKNIQNNFVGVNNDSISKLKYIKLAIVRETSRRQVLFSGFLNSITTTLHPKNILKSTFKLFYYTCRFFFYLPALFYYETVALYCCINHTHCKYPKTIIEYVYQYSSLIYNSTKEAYYYLKIIIKTPRTMLEEILLESGTVQTIPVCGRKVIAWSEPVNIDLIKEIANCTASSETEILLATISATMYRYYNEIGIQIPTYVPITIRNVNSDYVFRKGIRVKPQDFVSGLIALKLPVLIDDDHKSILENLQIVKRNFLRAVEGQQITYLLTILQTKYNILTNIFPPPFIEILLKYLSRKYTISLTEITNQYDVISHQSIWGQEVTNVVYWRPPQANMSVSLCFNQIGNTITLGVMCDAQLLPLHPLLAKEFPEHIDDLAQAIGIL